MQSFQHAIGRIAVWNLAGFGGIDDARKAKQIEGLAVLDAEFVTLVEVNPVSYIDELAAGLKDYGLDYKTTILSQNNGNLHIGFLHKEGMEVKNPTFIAGSEGGYANGRQAISVEVKCRKFSAVVIGVHLKSGRDTPEQKLRDSQCKVIGDHIAQLRETPGFKTKTILLMGDFNMIPGRDVSNFHFLGGDDLMDFVSSWDLQDRYSHILSKGRANLLDGFAISRTYSTDYIRGSLRLFPMHWTMKIGRETFKNEVSDHLPFVASFKLY